MSPLAVVTMLFGAVLALLGVFAFLKMGTKGKSTVKLFGAQFELGGSALVIFVVGALLFVVPWIYVDRSGAKPPPDDGKTVSGVEIPAVEGKPLSTAIGELAMAGLRVEIRRVETLQGGDLVLSQDPKGGLIVEPTTQVTVTIPDSVVTVPDVRGRELMQAVVELTQKGLKIGQQRSQIEGAGIVGGVIDQVPKANEKVALGTEVQLTVKGASVTVPTVTEIKWEIARDNITGAGLKVAAQWDESSTKPSGLVLLQRPTQGSQVAPGSEVLLTIAGNASAIRPGVLAQMRVLSPIRNLPAMVTRPAINR